MGCARSSLLVLCVLAAAARSPAEPPQDLIQPEGRAPIPNQETPPGIPSQSARACNACHWEIYDEWQGAMHSAAWSDPQFQELWRAGEREAGCMNCHSPLQIQQPRAAGGKTNTAFEPTVQAEGVTCAACHVRAGRIVGRGTSKTTPPHPVKVVAGLAGAPLCGACHQLSIPGAEKGMYDTFREWEATDWKKRGVGCRDCHMPARTGTVAVGVQRAYRDHSFRGGHSDLLLDRALSVSVRLDKPIYEAGDDVAAIVSIHNGGAGHHVPSGDPLHQVRAVMGIADQRGELLDKKEVVIARLMARAPPYRETADTRIRSGETRTIKYDGRFPGGLGEHYFVVQLSYHFMPPEQAHELGIPAEATSRVFHSQVIPITP